MHDLLRILNGDALAMLRELPDASVQCCVTSPPYWGLRDYGTAKWEGGSEDCDHKQELPRFNGPKQTSAQVSGHASKAESNSRSHCSKGCGAKRIDAQLGLEKTPEEYVARMVAVFQEVRRVLKDDGVLWLNLGDSYCTTAPGTCMAPLTQTGILAGVSDECANARKVQRAETPTGMKPKDLAEIPSEVARALRIDGWYLRSRIPWIKRNPMPESTSSRPTSAVEYVFMLTKSSGCYFDYEAVKVQAKPCTIERGEYGWSGITGDQKGALTVGARNGSSFHDMREKGLTMKEAGMCTETRSWRNSDAFFESWQGLYEEDGNLLAFVVNTNPYREAHFATFPERLVKPCILAGSKPGDTILDPFSGSGTTGMVALELGRKAVLIELNPEYCKLIERRCDVTPGLAFNV